jgi:hypothetical protein
MDPPVELVDEIQRVVFVEGEPLMRDAWDAGPPHELATVGSGSDRVGDFEQPPLRTAGSPRFLRCQIAAPRGPARRVAGHESLSPRRNDGDSTFLIVGILQVDALHPGRPGLECHEQVAARVGAVSFDVIMSQLPELESADNSSDRVAWYFERDDPTDRASVLYDQPAGDPCVLPGLARFRVSRYLERHFRCADPPTPNPDKYADELLDAYLFIENADALYAEYAARGAEFTRPLGDTPWNSREFVVKDCDGRLLAFGSRSK